DALQRWHPRIVMIALGANDGLRGKSLAQVEKNLEAMLRMVASADASAVLVGMHIPPNFGPRYGQAFHAIYARLAKRYSVQLLPFLLDGVATDSALMQDDGLHPTADAQPRIRDHVLQSLQPLLKKIAAS
ncbi:MAG: GDSL-type esterase/lipase family protein, partial [Pseudomonadales bacterium]